MFSFSTLPLEVPSNLDLLNAVKKGIAANFGTYSVAWVQTDLEKNGFGFPGLGADSDHCHLIEVGGVPNLQFPEFNTRTFPLASILSTLNLESTPAILGSGAKTYHDTDLCNGEAVYNCRNISQPACLNQLAIVSPCNSLGYGDPVLLSNSSLAATGALANLVASNGNSGSLLMVTASNRTGSLDFQSALLSGLGPELGSVGLGGVLNLVQGTMHMHVMPNFTNTFMTTEDISNWLVYFDVPVQADRTNDFHCASRLVNNPKVLTKGMAATHAHCYSPSLGLAGHYRNDITPAEAMYVAYYRPCSSISYIDYKN
jgi:hypothetical protein